MPENRFYLDSPFHEKNCVELREDEFHHLKVMRKNLGDPLELVNGKNELAECTLESITKNSARIQIEKIFRVSPKQRKIILAQALTRPAPLEYIIEKGTELGATEFLLFPAERSEKKELSENQRRRLHLITISAMKQCGRLDLPTILEKPSLSRWAHFAGAKYFGDVREKAPRIASSPSQEDILFFIGPESGFSDQEVKILENLQAKGVKLHENILRVDTAAIAALILMQNY